MGLEFSWLDTSNGSEQITLNQEDIDRIEGAVNFLTIKTGVFLDPYGDTRLSPEHALVLLQKIAHIDLKPRSKIGILSRMLDNSVKNKWWIVTTGD